MGKIDHGSTSSIGHCHPLARTRKKDILSVLKRDVLKKDAFYKQFMSKVNVMPKPLIYSTKPRSQADIFRGLIRVAIFVQRVSSLSQKQQDLQKSATGLAIDGFMTGVPTGRARSVGFMFVRAFMAIGTVKWFNQLPVLGAVEFPSRFNHVLSWR